MAPPYFHVAFLKAKAAAAVKRHCQLALDGVSAYCEFAAGHVAPTRAKPSPWM